LEFRLFNLTGNPVKVLVEKLRFLEEPQDYLVYHNLALSFKAMDQYDSAIEYFEKSLSLNNGNIAAFIETGDIFFYHKKDEIKAISYFEKYLQFNDKNPLICDRLGYLHQLTGNSGKAVDYFKKAVELAPGLQAAVDNLLFYSLKLPGLSQEDIYNLTKNTVEKFQKGSGFKQREIYIRQKRPRNKKINIGYISGDFHDHVTMRFIGPILENYDKERFRVTCYSYSAHNDQMTGYFKTLTDRFVDTNNLSDRETARLIYEDQTDILVDLSGHTTRTRLYTMMYKPAPVQVTYLGYPNTTGLETVDYFLTNSILSQPAEQPFFSEKLLFIEWPYCCFRYYFGIPDVKELPALKNGYITLGVFNALSKVNDSAIRLWSEILLRLPGAKLLVCRKEAREEILYPKFAAFGINRNRVLFINDFSYDRYNEVDIQLDTFPYTGATVAFDSVFMGVPLVTLYGHTFQGRVAANINYHLGLEHLVAKNEKEYIEKAVFLAKDIPQLIRLRDSLREKISGSPFCDYREFTRALEKAFIQMWNNYSQ
jgi:protein O-GlcNAc transferase